MVGNKDNGTDFEQLEPFIFLFRLKFYYRIPNHKKFIT